jgi:hypothetical protein
MLNSALKAFVAVQLHQHTSEVTARTPENTRHLTKSLFMVSVIGLVVAVIIAGFLYLHNGTIAMPVLVSGILFATMEHFFVKLK